MEGRKAGTEGKEGGKERQREGGWREEGREGKAEGGLMEGRREVRGWCMRINVNKTIVLFVKAKRGKARRGGAKRAEAQHKARLKERY